MVKTNRQKTKIIEFLQEEGEMSFNDIYSYLNTKRIMKDGRRRVFSTTTPQLVNILGKSREFTKTRIEKVPGTDGSHQNTLSFWGLSQ